MPLVSFETSELTTLIEGMNAAIKEHGCSLCAPAWAPILAKLAKARDEEPAPPEVPTPEILPNPKPTETKAEAKPKAPVSRPIHHPARPWTEQEDDILREYAGAGKNRFLLMQRALSGRNLSMIHSRVARLKLDKTEEPAVAETTTDTPVEQSSEAPEPAPPPPRPESMKDDEWSWAGKPPPLEKRMAGR